MPEYVVERIVDALNTRNKSVKGSRLLILGVAYKKDIEDVRESPALRVIKLLLEKKAAVHYHDPYISDLKEESFKLKSIKLEKKTVGYYDCVVILTDHSCYDLNSIVKESKLIFDTRGCTVGIKADNIIRLGE
jgi:UDP-N-acetyl-D-glucosamine dehydrogenase